MKKVLLILCLLLFTVKIFAQQFSQYNTGSLYDSFENPSQRAFTPDTSKMYASNFLFPNLNLNLYLTGDAQASLKSRAFLNKYDNSKLLINQGRYNTAIFNANAYIFMYKVFASFNGDQEMGFSWQLKGEGRGRFTDESVAAFNGTGSFATGLPYTNIFNNNYFYQTYHQVSFTYREKVNDRFAVGVKLSALMGIQYQKLNITSSSALYDNAADSATVGLAGKYNQSYVPGHFTPSDYLPSFRSPGAAISMGMTYRTKDNFILQANVKDLGFIHWSSRSNIYNFDGQTNILGLSTPAREDSIYNKVYNVLHGNGSNTIGSFTTPIDGRIELSANKSFWLDDDLTFKYSPTAIVSKELFYPGFIFAVSNPFQYDKYVFTVITSYDDLKIFSLGAQIMLKTANWEFYVGSDKLAQTVSVLGGGLSKNASSLDENSAYTGGNLYIGFSMKFGPVAEHPMNASSIPDGSKGFFARLWGRLFKTNN